MDRYEAVKEFYKYTKLRNIRWEQRRYIYLGADFICRNERGQKVPDCGSLFSSTHEKWEVYEEVTPYVDIVPQLGKYGEICLTTPRGYFHSIATSAANDDWVGWVWGESYSTTPGDWMRIVDGKRVICDAVRFRRQREEGVC